MNYIGIDLGTTNSAICSYDGETVRLYKSPDQNDVTPSAIFIDRRIQPLIQDHALASGEEDVYPGETATQIAAALQRGAW